MAFELDDGEYCGYINNKELVVTGFFDKKKSDYFSVLQDTDDPQKQIKISEIHFSPANLNQYLALTSYTKAECLIFLLQDMSISSNGEVNCRMSKMTVVTDGMPNYPGREFSKVLVQTEKKKVTPVVKKKNAFIETFKEDVSLKVPKIDKRFIPGLKDVYTNLAKNNNAICVMNVEPDWLHYDDYVNHGLVEFWDYAFANKSQNCYLVFDKINVTVIQSGLSPLFDVLNGNRPRLPFSENDGVPENIHILATVVDKANPYKLGLPLPEEFFSDWEALDSEGKTISVEEVFSKCD